MTEDHTHSYLNDWEKKCMNRRGRGRWTLRWVAGNRDTANFEVEVTAARPVSTISDDPIGPELPVHVNSTLL